MNVFIKTFEAMFYKHLTHFSAHFVLMKVFGVNKLLSKGIDKRIIV